jgi:hypothetical protein
LRRILGRYRILPINILARGKYKHAYHKVGRYQNSHEKDIDEFNDNCKFEELNLTILLSKNSKYDLG